MINVLDVVDFVSFVEHWKKLYTSVVHNLKMTNVIQYCPFSDLNNNFFLREAEFTVNVDKQVKECSFQETHRVYRQTREQRNDSRTV